MAIPDALWLRSQTITSRKTVILSALALISLVIADIVSYRIMYIGRVFFFVSAPLLLLTSAYLFGSLAVTAFYRINDATDSASPFRVTEYAMFRLLIIREAIRG